MTAEVKQLNWLGLSKLFLFILFKILFAKFSTCLLYTSFFLLFEPYGGVSIVAHGFPIRMKYFFVYYNLVLHYYFEKNSTLKILKCVRYSVHTQTWDRMYR